MRAVGRFGAVAAIAVLTASSAGVSAQTLDDIVARHIEARGGLDKLKAIQTVRITRTVATGIGSQVKVVIFKKRPQFFRVEQQSTAPGAPVSLRGVTPDGAWDTQGAKVVARPAQLAAETRDLDADFDGLLVDWKAKGHTLAYEGKEALVGGEAHKLKLTTKSGLVRTLYLDAATYLERRQTGLLNLPGNRQFDVTIDYANWRDVNGVKFPFDITEERTGKEPVVSLVTYTEKIEVNVPMEDTIFAMPKG